MIRTNLIKFSKTLARLPGSLSIVLAWFRPFHQKRKIELVQGEK